MPKSSLAIIDRIGDPVIQAVLTFGGAVLIICLAKVINLTGLMDVPQRFPWMAAASFMLVFAMGNSIYSLSCSNMLKYWGRSIYSYLGLAFLSGAAAYLFSSMSIDEAGSYRWIYIVLTIGYMVFLGMMAFMRQIVDFAQREEWNHPRIRQTKSGKRKRHGED
ncbi:hypothetical protein FRY97_19490 [Phaeodactylibacter luteus]|uniref:Uncharacterized protein n=1 Tax=Phaeodactylibacter luteus TaxID=1564516 RepID=A0A5C6RHL1_9BACT|nr:hypothetical protein FRY97_19490 [Phaeodactylibacter luteus]